MFKILNYILHQYQNSFKCKPYLCKETFILCDKFIKQIMDPKLFILGFP